MKERPILFSAPMVRALLAGTKTQTRRIVKSPHVTDADRWAHVDGATWESGVDGDHGSVAHGETVRCPYGARGDRLWVRETWAYFGGDEHLYQQDRASVSYRADGPDLDPPGGRWRPSIFMPRWASRIAVDVTNVRVERLQTITENDAMAEGIVTGRIPADEYGPPRIGYMVGADDGHSPLSPTAREAYLSLWIAINGSESWNANPWVWAVSFARVTR